MLGPLLCPFDSTVSRTDTRYYSDVFAPRVIRDSPVKNKAILCLFFRCRLNGRKSALRPKSPGLHLPYYTVYTLIIVSPA